MRLEQTAIEGLTIGTTTARKDDRGAFARLFCDSDLREVFGNRTIAQINHSRTHKVGAVRGLHFQLPPYAEMKLVRCLRGRVWDVAVDLRKGSTTFLKYHAEELSAENMHLMIIPEGFAHGFQVMEQDSELLYLHTTAYAPAYEGGLNHNDPRLKIEWPLAVTELSQRDLSHPHLTQSFTGIEIDDNE